MCLLKELSRWYVLKQIVHLLEYFEIGQHEYILYVTHASFFFSV